MSAENTLTEADRKLLDQIDDQIDEAEDPDEFEKVARDLRDEFAQLKAEFRSFQHEIAGRIDQLENGQTGQEVEDDAPPIVFYARMPQEEREENLSTSEQIAVTLHCEWSDIAWKLGDSDNRKIGVDTKSKANAKYNPSRLRHRLKEKLGWDPEAIQMYRGLKRLAKLSGGEEKVNASDNRVHVVGGIYEYREMTTADNMDVKRVLWRQQE